jgi:hypothetical protein
MPCYKAPILGFRSPWFGATGGREVGAGAYLNVTTSTACIAAQK